jgi:5-methylcytosine-specific restriction endonuclease McrA
MAIAVFRAFSIRDAHFVSDGPWPNRAGYRLGDVAAVLTSLPRRTDGADPGWELPIEIGTGPSARRVVVPLQPFLTREEHDESQLAPFPFARLSSHVSGSSIKDPDLGWLWLYRDAVYVTERLPRPSEIPEVIVRIKALHFQQDEGLKRLKEQVTNYEAVEDNLRRDTNRKTIPDDVKLVVWSRDKGACVRCGASKELHFDHIIPLARGGSDEAENIQVLCRTCNLAKSDRIV